MSIWTATHEQDDDEDPAGPMTGTRGAIRGCGGSTDEGARQDGRRYRADRRESRQDVERARWLTP